MRSSLSLRVRKVACGDCNLAEICIPCGLQPEAISNLSHVVRRSRVVHKGDIIYHAGERFTGIYALRSGSAKLVHTNPEGHEVIIALLLPGELLGFDGLYSDQYQCTLVALEHGSYCELSAHDLEQLSRKVPAIQRILLQRTGAQFEQSIAHIAVTRRPAEERMAAFLLDLSQRYGRRGFSAEQFELTLSRAEIGNHLNLALATVSRLLSRFEAAGHLRVRGRRVQIVNAEDGQTVKDSPGFEWKVW